MIKRKKEKNEETENLKKYIYIAMQTFYDDNNDDDYHESL